MIVDFHNHLGQPWGTRLAQTPQELLERMDRAGIDRAVVFPFPFGNFDNDYVGQAARQHADRFIPFVMVSPWQRGSIRDYVARHVDAFGCRGVKLHAAAHGYKMSELTVIGPILDAAEEFQLPVMAYSGDELYATPLQFLIAAERYPNVTFVMAHSGFMMHTADSILVAERCSNVYLEQSAAISLGVTHSVEAVGANRVLMGSDTPHMEFEVELKKMEIAITSAADRALVVGGNAAFLLGLASSADGP